jgi:hypothetical protein
MEKRRMALDDKPRTPPINATTPVALGKPREPFRLWLPLIIATAISITLLAAFYAS